MIRCIRRFYGLPFAEIVAMSGIALFFYRYTGFARAFRGNLERLRVRICPFMPKLRNGCT
jgi:hypothetical protein